MKPDDGWKIPTWVMLICIVVFLFLTVRAAINNIIQNRQQLKNGTYVSP